MPFGLDTNIVCYMLDPSFPEHTAAGRVLRSLSSQSTGAINPTVLHESYHTLVYAQLDPGGRKEGFLEPTAASVHRVP